jgi:hypothetical protein
MQLRFYSPGGGNNNARDAARALSAETYKLAKKFQGRMAG